MNKTSTHLLFAIIAAGLLAACQTRQAATVAAAPAATSIELRAPGAGLYTAGQPAAGDWQVIAARGVTTVINLRPQAEMAGRDEAGEVAQAGMRYAEIPVSGTAGITIDNARALRTLLQDASGPVLVHCGSGNRVGALIALAAADAGASAEDAIAQGRAAGMTGAEARVRELLAAPARSD